MRHEFTVDLVLELGPTVPVLFILMEFANAGTLETLLRVTEDAEVCVHFFLDRLESGQLNIRPMLLP